MFISTVQLSSVMYSRGLVRVSVNLCAYNAGHYATEVWLTQVMIVLFIFRPPREEQ